MTPTDHSGGSETERYGPVPCERHRCSSSLQEMADCSACNFRNQYIAEAASILAGHPGLQPWEPLVLAEAMLIAVGLIERAEIDGLDEHSIARVRESGDRAAAARKPKARERPR